MQLPARLILWNNQRQTPQALIKAITNFFSNNFLFVEILMNLKYYYLPGYQKVNECNAHYAYVRSFLFPKKLLNNDVDSCNFF